MIVVTAQVGEIETDRQIGQGPGETLQLIQSRLNFGRQLLAQVLQHDDRLVQMRRETETTRLIQIDELRFMEEGGQGVNIDASVSRRSYAGQLSGNLGEIDARRGRPAAVRNRRFISSHLVHGGGFREWTRRDAMK